MDPLKLVNLVATRGAGVARGDTSTGEGTGARPAHRAIRVLRLGLGVVWSLNLLYIVDPANQFLPTFAATVQSVASPLSGGPAVLAIVTSQPLPFAFATALLTGFLAVAFLTGRLVRWACAAGLGFNATLLWLQLGSLVTLPGGTDVGPHPLYLLAYVALWVAHAPVPASGPDTNTPRSERLPGVAMRLARAGARVWIPMRPRRPAAGAGRARTTGRWGNRAASARRP